VSWAQFLGYCVLGLALYGTVAATVSMLYFRGKARREEAAHAR
jgi:hypothetical protein